MITAMTVHITIIYLGFLRVNALSLKNIYFIYILYNIPN